MSYQLGQCIFLTFLCATLGRKSLLRNHLKHSMTGGGYVQWGGTGKGARATGGPGEAEGAGTRGATTLTDTQIPGHNDRRRSTRTEVLLLQKAWVPRACIPVQVWLVRRGATSGGGCQLSTTEAPPGGDREGRGGP